MVCEVNRIVKYFATFDVKLKSGNHFYRVFVIDGFPNQSRKRSECPSARKNSVAEQLGHGGSCTVPLALYVRTTTQPNTWTRFVPIE